MLAPALSPHCPTPLLHNAPHPWIDARAQLPAAEHQQMPLGKLKKKKGEPDITDEFGGLSSEEEEEEEVRAASDEDEPIYKVADEDGQVDLDPPVRYQARSKAKVRILSAVDSDEVGAIEKNEWILVTHTKDVNGQCRLRFNRGWTSYKSAKGYNLMLMEGEKNSHYKQLPGKEIDIRKAADPASEVVGKVQKLSILEALEVTTPAEQYKGKFPYTGQQYVRMSEGWVSTHAVADKMVGGVLRGVVETPCLAVEAVHDPEGDARREREAVEAAKQAKLDEQQAKKDRKKNKKQGLVATKADLAATQAFEANLSKALESLPEFLGEQKTGLEECRKTALQQVERLQKEVHDLDGTNIKQQKAEVVAIDKLEKELGALLGSMPDGLTPACAADIECVA